MSIGSRIRDRRLALGLTQEETARRLGISKGAVANYENEVSTPKTDILCAVMRVLDCDANYLFQDAADIKSAAIDANEYSILERYRSLDARGRETVEKVIETETELHRRRTEEGRKARKYPVLYYDFPVSAGTGEYLDDSTARVIELAEEPPEATDYILRISGDSMEPKFHDGDKVFVRRTDAVDYGDIGIFVYNGSVYMKKYTPDGLISLNPRYAPIKGSGDMRCLGRVLGVVVRR